MRDKERTGPISSLASAEVLDLLASLVQKSLVVYEEDEQGQGHYRLLETVRQYGRDRLSEAGGAAARDRHLTFFLALAEAAEPELWRDVNWLDRLEREHDNLRAALEWCVGSSAESGLRLAGALWWFWSIRGHWTEARQRLETALAGSGSVEAGVRWKALCAAGYIAAGQGGTEAARILGAESLALCRQAGDEMGIAWSLVVMAEAAQHQGRFPEAAALAEEGLALFREGGDRRGTALALHMLAAAIGCGAFRQGLSAEALEEECLTVCRQEGYRWLTAVSLSHLGFLGSGLPERARALFEESLAIHREFGNRAASAAALQGLANLAWADGDLDRAGALFEERLALLRECGDKPGCSVALGEIGRIALARGEYARARASFEEALSLSSESADALLGLASLAHAQGDVKTARALLGKARTLPQVSHGRSRQGHLLLGWGDYGGARSCYEEYLSLLRAGDHRGHIPFALLYVGLAAWLQGEPGVTRSHAAEAPSLFREQESADGMLAALESLAVAALAQGRKEHAARLMGAVEAWSGNLGYAGRGWWRALFRERISEAVRAAALEQEFAAAWAEGRAMSLEEAVNQELEA